ncbi:hypothetical protein LBMAG21_02290 [Armatimonadota bacterium]|nr:hypothetical protein LBMAG21_02290 [Armatimonadota bacterium]
MRVKRRNNHTPTANEVAYDVGAGALWGSCYYHFCYWEVSYFGTRTVRNPEPATRTYFQV